MAERRRKGPTSRENRTMCVEGEGAGRKLRLIFSRLGGKAAAAVGGQSGKEKLLRFYSFSSVSCVWFILHLD